MVNDLITCGALPWSIAMHAAVGDAKWFDQGTLAKDLADGFAHACRESNAVWGGGETPALKGIVNPETIVLAGSAVGRLTPKSARITGRVSDGDAIVFLASTGVQTNGLTLCRTLADRLPDGYLTRIDDGRTYGEALLDASAIYVKFVAALQQAKLQPNYLAHVTGHGWRKLMRLAEPFVYTIDNVREPLPVFGFIEKAGQVERREMYATFNMGVGFAAYVSPADADRCVQIARSARTVKARPAPVRNSSARTPASGPSWYATGVIPPSWAMSAT
jgi:phosphoribosylformylglycinamidine cyclo-ligase